MFREWFKANKMGYRPIQAGIMRRFLREEGAWGSHLNKTREYILESIKETNPRSVRILGSGWLLDIPIQELINVCESIVLVDIIHPPQVVNKYSKYSNVTFESADITGGLVDLCYSQSKKGFEYDSFIDQLQSVKPIIFSEDLIISANLTSQLSVMLTDYLSAKLKLTNTQITSVAEVIQQKHLEILPRNKSVLITDFEEEYYDEDDKFIGSKPTVYINLPVNGTRKEWGWKFDTKMFYKEDCKTILKVVAVRL